MVASIILIVQLSVTVIMGVYFYRQLKSQGDSPSPGRASTSREMEKLDRLRAVSLSCPLSERVRPLRFSDLVGQEEAVRALKAVICCKNPQHVLLYGPPGVGKTCAARLVLECARATPGTPFAPGAPFIEMDATCVRFDERAIADPLIGSVHDPIYQGAGQLGIGGIPQPKEGAVTRAHGGVLFLDEIGELHPMQMNKLLKVLEDRKVRFESAYYDPEDRKTPRYIHDIFENGLPADFRLIGATTRAPEELPPALRSRCMEIFFKPLEPEHLARIALGAAEKAGVILPTEEAERVANHAANGREAVNMVQMALGAAEAEGRKEILRGDVEWVIDCGHYAPRGALRPAPSERPGRVLGLGVTPSRQGTLLEIEAVAYPGSGAITVTGIVEEEEIRSASGKYRRTSMARAAALNGLALLRGLGFNLDRVDLHLNFPGSAPVDGPSAGAAMALAILSAVEGAPIPAGTAVTGEISAQGRVLPVGGVTEKIDAAQKAGLERVIIPAGNMSPRYENLPVRVLPVSDFEELLGLLWGERLSARSLCACGAHFQRPDPLPCAARGQ